MYNEYLEAEGSARLGEREAPTRGSLSGITGGGGLSSNTRALSGFGLPGLPGLPALLRQPLRRLHQTDKVVFYSATFI